MVEDSAPRHWPVSALLISGGLFHRALPSFVVLVTPSATTSCAAAARLLPSYSSNFRQPPKGSSDDGGALPHSKRVAVDAVSGRSASCAITLPSRAAEAAAIAWTAPRRVT